MTLTQALISAHTGMSGVVAANSHRGDNWRTVSAQTHLEHALEHVRVALSDPLCVDTGGDNRLHIDHALCRLAMARAVATLGD